MIPDKTNIRKSVNKANMRKWVAALRSGEFKQGNNRLLVIFDDPEWPDAYCCMGVACRLAIDEGVKVIEKVEKGLLPDRKQVRFGTRADVLPPEVMQWLGLDESNPPVSTDSAWQSISAIKANDAYLWSFDRIADAIEEFYELKEEHDDPR